MENQIFNQDVYCTDHIGSKTQINVTAKIIHAVV